MVRGRTGIVGPSLVSGPLSVRAKPISAGRAIRGIMQIPAIVLNFKPYPEILGKKGWEVAKRLAAGADETGASIVFAPPTSDLAHLAKLVHIPVFSQHVDAVDAGQTTGWSPPEALLEAGAAGTLINHSERKVAWEEMAKSVPRCRELGLEVIACADDIVEAETLAKLSPEYIAIEPPELIGGGGWGATADSGDGVGAVPRIRAREPDRGGPRGARREVA